MLQVADGIITTPLHSRHLPVSLGYLVTTAQVRTLGQHGVYKSVRGDNDAFVGQGVGMMFELCSIKKAHCFPGLVVAELNRELRVNAPSTGQAKTSLGHRYRNMHNLGDLHNYEVQFFACFLLMTSFSPLFRDLVLIFIYHRKGYTANRQSDACRPWELQLDRVKSLAQRDCFICMPRLEKREACESMNVLHYIHEAFQMKTVLCEA